MNTIEELTNTYGIEISTAQRMVESYMKHIGEGYGEYRLTDMEYVGDKERRIELTCKECGEKIYRIYINGRNKLRELPKKCKACEEKEKEAEEAEKKSARNNVIQNKIGQIVGDYRIRAVIGNKYKCECITCSAIKEVSVQTVIDGKWKSTRCTKHTVKIKYNESYIGKKRNYLTITGYDKDTCGKKAFVCKCDCGREVKVKPALWEQGKIKSCGCYQENRSKDANEIKRIKSIYRGMKNRCLNKASKDYYNYGGRGIVICDEWLNDEEKFIEWSLKNGYANTLTIDRIDFNGNYEPGNCRWTTYKVQNTNRRPRGKNVTTNR